MHVYPICTWASLSAFRVAAGLEPRPTHLQINTIIALRNKFLALFIAAANTVATENKG